MSNDYCYLLGAKCSNSNDPKNCVQCMVSYDAMINNQAELSAAMDSYENGNYEP